MPVATIITEHEKEPCPRCFVGGGMVKASEVNRLLSMTPHPSVAIFREKTGVSEL